MTEDDIEALIGDYEDDREALIDFVETHPEVQAATDAVGRLHRNSSITVSPDSGYNRTRFEVRKDTIRVVGTNNKPPQQAMDRQLVKLAEYVRSGDFCRDFLEELESRTEAVREGAEPLRG